MRFFVIRAALIELCFAVRFLKLSPNIALPPGSFRAELNVPSEKDCGRLALTEELKAGNVTHFVFESTSSPACRVYNDVASLELVQDIGEIGQVTFVKQADGFSYAGMCLNEEQSKEAVKALLSEIPRPTPIVTPSTNGAMSTIKTTSPSKASVKNKQAGVLLDGPGLTRKSRVACPCTTGATPVGRQEFWQTLSSGNHNALGNKEENVIDLSCARKQDLCVCDEQGACFVPGAKAANTLVLFPLCDKGGCHTYVLQSTADYGASLKSGKATIFEKSQYTSDGYLKDAATYNPVVYIRAAAISCRGCKFIRNIKNVTCSLPSG